MLQQTQYEYETVVLGCRKSWGRVIENNANEYNRGNKRKMLENV